MSKTLLLLRHGKSDWGNANAADFERPLAKRGQQAATQMGLYLTDQELLPDVIVSSPAKRALSTAELIQDELTDVDITENDLLYEAELDTLLDVVAGLPDDADTVMLVGHNPGMEELCDELTGRDDSVFKTCTLGILRSSAGGWADSAAASFKLEKLVNPTDVG